MGRKAEISSSSPNAGFFLHPAREEEQEQQQKESGKEQLLKWFLPGRPHQLISADAITNSSHQ